jgi:hypothetical protein
MKKFKNLNPSFDENDNITYQILESINFFERYKEISERYQGHSSPDYNFDNKQELKSIFKDLGYNVKITSRIISFKEVVNDKKNIICFNIGFYKLGMCDLHFYLLKNDHSEESYILGDIFVRLYKTKGWIQKNDYNQSNILDPKFTSYDEFKQIMQEFLPLYEDMKQAFIESGIRSKEDVENYFED